MVEKKEYACEERILALLKQRRFTVTTTESCTGGLLAGRLLNAAGASEVYKEGYITYSNEAKEKLLGVSRRWRLTVPSVNRPRWKWHREQQNRRVRMPRLRRPESLGLAAVRRKNRLGLSISAAMSMGLPS